MKPATIFKGFKNFSANYFWALLKIPSSVPLPLEMQIEPSSVCNLKCNMCSLKNETQSKNIYLKKENFTKAVDNLKNIRTINFTGIGESLMNKDLAGLIKIAKEKTIETMFITNGQLLNVENINDLIKSGLDKICISMESGELGAYERFRKGAKFEILKRNVELLTNKISKTKNNMQVVINTVLLKENLKNPENLERIIDFAFVNNIKLITFQFPHDVSEFNLSDYFKKDKDNLLKIFGSLKKYADQKRITIDFPLYDVKKGSCYYPWIYPQITANGELLPCCIIPQFGNYSKIIEEFSFGNVFEKSFRVVWNSQKAILFRKSLQIKKPNKYCRKCSKYRGIL